MQDLSVADRIEIQELIARYYQAEDGGEVEPWVGCFTGDGGFKSRAGQSYFGHEQLRSFAVKRSQRPDARLYIHWVTNMVITATAEGARAQFYSMTVGQAPEGCHIRGMALNTDELRQEAGRWRFKTRDSVTLPLATG